MNKAESLKKSRDLLLKLHKALVDFERESYVSFNGQVTPGQFLNQLLDNPGLSWLRKFSTLIVDIDEMFAQKDGFTDAAVEAHLSTAKRLVLMDESEGDFKSKYQMALQGDADAASLHAELKRELESK
ncbi:MAG TPA: hypothetical protein VK468_10990 [Pyrinomonadaceae bacterium]|nr:hypothetical protein [Pyrinomonadaceae bacterium]